MATRSTISVLLDNGTVKKVYCHWDGYLSNNGSILQEKYNDLAAVNELVSLGDMSSLDSIATTVYYGRDRGETDTTATVFASLSDYYDAMVADGEEYDYLFSAGHWTVYHSQSNGEWVPIETTDS